MKPIYIGAFCISTFLFLACKSQQTSPTYSQVKTAAFILEEGLLDCFPEGTKTADGDIYNCEFSAVAPWAGGLIFGNDKNTPHISPIVIHDNERLLKGKAKIPATLPNPAFFDIRKIEDFAYSIDGRYLFISSGFDRLKKDNSWDAYNQLLAWDIEQNEIQIIAAEEHQGVISSKSIRQDILSLLSTPYIKIEGLMILPNNRIVLGVREVGESDKNPTYTATLIENQYHIENGKILLDKPWEIKYQLDMTEVKEDLGLSSLYYDKEKKKIYITTSLEEGAEGEKVLGGYIWSLPLADYKAKKNAQLIRYADGTPVVLRHKVEGITKMDNGNYFIIYDDDRTPIPVKLPSGTINRQQHQAVYSIIQLP